MKINRNLAWALVALQVLCIIALVPFGRTVQGIVQDFRTALPDIFQMVIYGVVTTAIIFGGVYYYRLARLASFKRLALHLFLCTALLIIFTNLVQDISEYSHLLTYGLLGAFIWLLIIGYRFNRAMVAASLGCIGVSLMDETLQGLHPQRFFDLRDLWMNLLSSLLGIMLIRPWLTSYKHQ